MKINLIVFGKIKHKPLVELIDKFKTNIKHYFDFEIICLPVSKIKNEDNQSEINLALKKEAEFLKKYLDNKNTLNVLLDLNGKELNSIQFANKLNEYFTNYKTINFYIGSSFGFDEQLKSEIKNKICFSKMTFNHQIEIV